MDGGEFLQASHPPETCHRPRPSSERQLGVLYPVVEVTICLLAFRIANLLQRRAVGPEPVGDNDLGVAVSLE